MEMSLDWVTHTFVNIWQPMLLGCLLLGTTAALVAYVTLDLVWRSSLGQYKSRKRRQRRDRHPVSAGGGQMREKSVFHGGNR